MAALNFDPTGVPPHPVMVPDDMSELGTVAIRYAASGLHVFPCRPDNKRPYTQHGFYDASDDAEQIEAWWRRWPGAMIGVRTGPESGIWALDGDIDLPKGINGLAAISAWEGVNVPIPTTAVSRTPRGGRHWLFRWSDGIRNSSNKVAVGVDVRGEGGYFIVPPSVRTDGTTYSWHTAPDVMGFADAPPWLIDLVMGHAIPDPFPQQGKPVAQSGWADRSLDRPASNLRATGTAPRINDDGPRDFWREVKDRALANLTAWVPHIFPSAHRTADGAYRVRSKNLSRDLEEDLSLHPEGIKDFGVHDMGDAREGGRTAIDIVRDFLPARDATEAALWLCGRLGIRREDIGWQGARRNEGQTPRDPFTDHAEPATARKRIRATPFVYRDPSLIPPREWVYGRHLIRRFLSTTVAPGAVGKSSLVLVEAIAMVTGRALLGVMPPKRMRVWYVNLEDPLEETERRVAAICLHYGIDGRDLEGRLFLDSGRTAEIIIATRQRDGVKIAEPVIEDVTASMAENEIDHLVIDPFVSSHRVTENANDEIDIVAKAWNRVAEIGNASIELVHHVRKGQAGQGEYTVEDGRGAGALLAAARSARVLNLMSKDQAEKAGIPTNKGFFRVDNGKANLAPPPDKSEWFHLASVSLGNWRPSILNDGDDVAVVEPWEWPDAFEGVDADGLLAAQAQVAGCTAAGARFRLNVQSPDWVGVPIARALKLDTADKAHRSKVSRMLKVWIDTGMFAVVEGKDEKHRVREFVEVGKHASDAGE